MAQNFMKSLAGAFDKLGSQGNVLGQIAVNTENTAVSLAVGGEFYDRMDAMATAIEDIRDGKGKSVGGGLGNAMAIAILAPSMEPLGKGLQFVVDAVNNLEDTGEDVKAKMEGLAAGITLLGDVGKSILKFAGYMVLATPLLMVAVLGTPLIALTLRALIAGINFGTKNLDQEKLEKVKMMGDVGKSILILAATLALVTLISKSALEGALVSVLLIGTIALIAYAIPDKVLDKMKSMGTAVLDVALGLLALSLTFALVSIIAGPAIKGAILSIFVIGAIALAFYVLEEFGVIDNMEKAGKGLMFAGLSILALGVSLALFQVLMPDITTVLMVVGTVIAIGLAFALVGIAGDYIENGAKSLLWVSLSIIVLGLSLLFFGKIIGNITGEEAAKSLGALLVIGLLAAGFALIGLGEQFIKKGAIAMILVGASLIVIGIGFKIITAALGPDPLPMIGATMALIGGLGIVFGIAGAGPIPAFIALGAGAMIVAGVALLAVGAGIAVISKVLSGGNIDKLTDEKTGLVPVFKAIGEAFVMWPWTAAGILLGSGAMVAAGVALMTVGLGLKRFAKLQNEGLDLPELGKNISLMLGTLAVPFHKIGAGEEMEVLGADGTITKVKFGGGGGGLFGLGKKNTVAVGVASTLNMGKALTGIAKGVQAMANLKFPTAFDKEGNPTSFETIGGDAFKKVITNTMMMVGSLAVPFAKIGMGGEQEILGPDGNPITVDFGKPSSGGLLGFLSGGGAVQMGIKSVMNMGQALSNIAGGVQDMALLKFPTGFDKEGKATGYRQFNVDDAKAVADNTQMLVGSLTGTFQEIGSNPNAQNGSWWGGKSTIEKGIAIVTGIGEPLLNLAKGVEAMAKLKFPIYDKDGKITGYQTIGNAEGLKDKIKTNTQMLIEALTDTLMAIGGGKAQTSSWWGGETTFEKGIEIVSMIGEPYKKLGESVKTIIEIVGNMDSKAFAGKMADIIGVFTNVGEGADPQAIKEQRWMIAAIGNTFEKMGNSVPGVITAINGYNPEVGNQFFGALLGPVDEGARAEGYAKQATLWATIGGTMVKTSESMPAIAESINSMDLAKVTELRTLFEALGVLSEGGEPSDILAQMGESLEAALQNLADMLAEFKGSVEEGAAAQVETGGVISGAIKKITGGGSSSRSSGGDNTQVVAAINKLQSTLVSQGIKVKKSGSGFFS
jgi:hypothetical protein